MASRHLKQDPKATRRHLVLVAVLAMAFGAVTAAVLAYGGSGDPVAVQAAAAVPSVQQSISQQGRIVAVSPTSVTAQSVDGFARTYVIDGQTNAITEGGSLVGGAGTAFAVNDQVAIVGVVRDGTAVATAVADQHLSNLNGPPMDGV